MERNLKELISQMTLEEKAGMCSGLDFWHLKGVERLGIPSVMVSDGPHGLRKQDDKADHLGINDSIKAVCFPPAVLSACSYDRKLLEKLGEVVGDEAQAKNLSVVLGPAVNIKRSPLCGRNFEYYSEDPYLAGEAAASFINGVQSRHVGTSIKHFAANNQEFNRMSASSEVDERTLREIYLPAFETAVKQSQPYTVMCSYNKINGTYASENPWLLTEVLRDEWGFKGYVVSDSEAVEFISTKHQVANGYEDAVAQAVNAGLNIRTHFTPPADFILPLRSAVKKGKISQETLNQRVAEILRVKFWLGLFDNPYRGDEKRAGQIVHSPEHQQLALEAARQSLVLLKNEHQTLPLSKSIRSVAVIGPNADERQQLICRYGPANAHITTIYEGIKKMLPQADVVYKKGCDIIDPHFPESEVLEFPKAAQEAQMMEEAIEAAKGAEVTVMVLGGNELTVREDRSRTSLDLPGRQKELLKKICQLGKPVVLVMIDGRASSINFAATHVPAIIHAWFPGEFGGQAIAEALFGDYNPGGRLAVTFPKSVGQIPFAFPFKPGSDESSETSVYGALYPFGHGLSYTTFQYSDLAISPSKQGVQGNISISCTIKNIGQREGDEVVQLYLRDEVSSVTTYTQVLRGFERITLKPEASHTVHFELTPQELGIWDKQMNFTVEPGMFKVMIGSSSKDIRLKGEFEIAQ